MPVADYKIYCKMLERPGRHFAYPAINVYIAGDANGVLKGWQRARVTALSRSRQAVRPSLPGASVKDMALGAISIAEHVHRAAERYPVYVALHTDHCQPDHLDRFVLPLIEETEHRRPADCGCKPALGTEGNGEECEGKDSLDSGSHDFGAGVELSRRRRGEESRTTEGRSGSTAETRGDLTTCNEGRVLPVSQWRRRLEHDLESLNGVERDDPYCYSPSFV